MKTKIFRSYLFAAALAVFLPATAALADCSAPPIPNENFTAIHMAPISGSAMVGMAKDMNARARGTLAFDWNRNELVVCNGTEWKPASGGGGAQVIGSGFVNCDTRGAFRRGNIGSISFTQYSTNPNHVRVQFSSALPNTNYVISLSKTENMGALYAYNKSTTGFNVFAGFGAPTCSQSNQELHVTISQ